jgi:hypothetical protein
MSLHLFHRNLGETRFSNGRSPERTYRANKLHRYPRKLLRLTFAEIRSGGRGGERPGQG